MQRHTHQIGNGNPQLLRSNSYNKLGQLIRKAVGGTDLTGATAFQKVNYRYTIRGWLTDINDANQLLKSGDPNDLFGFKINYNTVENATGYEGDAQYNGNISETYWATATDDGVLRKYGYFYDNLNRLSEAVYMKPDNITPVTQSYNEKMSYNKNGNIRRLERYGNQDTNFPFKIDHLDYTYKSNSNQLLKVSDTEGIDGFKDSVNNSEEYDYDAQGNLLRDDNKGISEILYNHINLPTSITFATGQRIEYIYNAFGVKVSKKVIQAGLIQQTDYQGGFQYVDNRLAFFPTAEGYVDATGGGYKYVFQYKDHLGNIRLSYTQKENELRILEENNYYPYGMKHAGYNSSVFDYKEVGGSTVIDITNRNKSQYKYNGQEFQDELGLNMTAMDFRQYDNALGRFHCIDPVDHYSQSPYNGLDNNPVFWADPSGANVIDSPNSVTFDGADAGAFFNALRTALSGGVGVYEIQEQVFTIDVELPEVLIYGRSNYFSVGGGGGLLGNIQYHAYLNSPYYEYFRDEQSAKKWSDFGQDLQDIGDVISVIGYGLTATGVFAEVGVPLAAIGNGISLTGTVISTANSFYNEGLTSKNGLKSAGFFVAGQVAEHYLDKIPGLEPTIKTIGGDDVMNLSNKILQQNISLKLMGIERYIDSQYKKE